VVKSQEIAQWKIPAMRIYSTEDDQEDMIIKLGLEDMLVVYPYSVKKRRTGEQTGTEKLVYQFFFLLRRKISKGIWDTIF
jgi:hypothetical protein